MARDGAAMSSTVSNRSRRRILDLLDEVARLEERNATKDAALRDMVAIAAERLIQFPADGYFRQLYDIGCAALSGAGKCWLEVRRFVEAVEQRDWLALVDMAGLANTSRGLLALYQEEAPEREPARIALLTDAAHAALDALKGE